MIADRKLQREALFLYFCQMAKCAYCGKPLIFPPLEQTNTMSTISRRERI